MGDYFKPWRSKIGVVSLVMSCVFAAGMVRSAEITDTLLYETANSCTQVSSTVRTIWWGETTFSATRIKFFYPANYYYHYRTSDLPSYETETNRWNTQFQSAWAGFVSTVRIRDGERLAIWIVPYWSITIPMTLISLWLLLSKPRTIQNKITDPVSENVA